MKKVLFILMAMLIGACSTSDDSQDTQDTVIGVWKPILQGIIFNDGSELDEPVSLCEQNNRITFMADGSFSQTDYQESNDPNCMQPAGNPYLSGTWTRLSEGKYRIELVCSIPDCNDVQTNIPESISFPSDNLMRVRDLDEEPGDNIEFVFLELERLQ